MSGSSRREFVKTAASQVGMLSIPSLLSNPFPVEKKLKIVCLGAHPDDPESGCGGTLAKFAGLGYPVTIIYLTRGEAGITGKSNEEAAAIRSNEALAACKILNAKAIFAGQVDADTVMNNDWVKKIEGILAEERPDIVFTHWPVDSHKDHQIASLLTIQSWVRAKQRFELYFFEVCIGEQTMTFRPTDYIDITSTQEQKRKSVFCHASQDPSGIYECGHQIMEKFRGAEMGVNAAEGFVRAVGKDKGNGFSW
jgi:LmbE family N-acetylglucosaminyl deacetylase